MIRKFKINNIKTTEKEFIGLCFGQQLPIIRAFETFKAGARLIYISQKRKPYQKAIKEAIDLYNVKEYYCQFENGKYIKDDSFQFWFN